MSKHLITISTPTVLYKVLNTRSEVIHASLLVHSNAIKMPTPPKLPTSADVCHSHVPAMLQQQRGASME